MKLARALLPNSQKRSLDAVAVADLLLRKYMVYKNDINTIKYHVQYLYSMQNNMSISICIYFVIV